MRIARELDYRNAKAVLKANAPGILDEVVSTLTHPGSNLDFERKGKQRTLSKQVQGWFVERGWKKEAPSFTISDMRYDPLKDRIPVEIELGHQRLVFPDFFEFLADFSKG